MNIIIIQRRYDCISSLETLKLKDSQGYGAQDAFFKSRLYALIVEVKQMLEENIDKYNKHIKSNKRRTDYKIYNSVKELIKDAESDDLDKMTEAFDYLDRFLYYKEIIKIDTKRVGEWTSPSDLNEDAGI